MPSSDWTRVLYEAIDDAVFVHDEQGNILDANPAACRRLGYTRAEMLQLNTRHIDAPEFAAGFHHRLEEQLSRGNIRCEGLHRTKDGRIIAVDINTSAIDVGGKPAILAVMRDITQRKRIERRLQAQFELARVIATDRDFADSAREILQILCEGLDFEVGLLWGRQAPHEALSCLQCWHPAHAHVAVLLQHSQRCGFSATADLVGQVWQEGQQRYDRLSQSAWSSSPRWQAAQQAGLRGVLAFPIFCGKEIIGVLELWTRWSEEIDEALLALLQAMANQIGQFLNRQQVENELRHSQTLYESLVESLPQNIFRKNAAGQITFGNQRYCASLNRPLADLLGKTDFDLFPLDLAQKYVSDDQHIMRSGHALDTIEEHELPDGNQLFVHVVKTPVRNGDNEVVGVQGIFWDVTQEVRVNQAITASEKRYRQLTEATMDGIVVLDSLGSITLFNPAAERMFGYRAEEVVGLPANVLIPREFQLLHDEGVAHYLATHLHEMLGKPHEFKGRRKDGVDFPVEIALSLLTDPGGGATLEQPPVLILAAIRDLTERNKMRAVLIQNEKLASIGLLSAGVAHEINNPLAFIGNNLVVLERDSKSLLELLALYESADAILAQALPELRQRIQALIEDVDLPYIKEHLGRLINRTRDGIDRVTRIVHSLRGMARTEPPRLQEIRLPDVIDSSLEILHGKYKRLGVVVEQIHDPLPLVSCVPTQISQVVLNLLVNAFQAIETAKRTSGRIDVRTKRLGEEMLLEIKDNGSGIKPDHVAMLFDPFFTTKDIGEGTGLGLSISHHIITAHGGRIEVESQPGEGTCFRIFLPLKGPSNLP